jgi:hypothetical protein
MGALRRHSGGGPGGGSASGPVGIHKGAPRQRKTPVDDTGCFRVIKHVLESTRTETDRGHEKNLRGSKSAGHTPYAVLARLWVLIMMFGTRIARLIIRKKWSGRQRYTDRKIVSWRVTVSNPIRFRCLSFGQPGGGRERRSISSRLRLIRSGDAIIA